jgi:hypothetical protein
MKRSTLTIIILLVLVGAALGGYALAKTMPTGVVKEKGENVSDISAVFVNGGGIYFGKITKLDSLTLSLDEVYTYGVVQSDNATKENQETKPTLFDASKVGIAPASHYNISREQVILWYSLKNDSDVVKTIESYKKANK